MRCLNISFFFITKYPCTRSWQLRNIYDPCHVELFQPMLPRRYDDSVPRDRQVVEVEERRGGRSKRVFPRSKPRLYDDPLYRTCRYLSVSALTSLGEIFLHDYFSLGERSKVGRNWVESCFFGNVTRRLARCYIFGAVQQTWFPWISKSNASLWRPYLSKSFCDSKIYVFPSGPAARFFPPICNENESRSARRIG